VLTGFERERRAQGRGHIEYNTNGIGRLGVDRRNRQWRVILW
jgi:hypothetical protein